MSWVSVSKFKTVCEAIKNHAIEQGDDAYNKAVSYTDSVALEKVNVSAEMTETELITLTNLFN